MPTDMSLKDRAVRQAVVLLDNPDAGIRCLTLQFLGRVGATDAAERIAVCLWDEDLDVCNDAAVALGKLRDASLPHVSALLEFYDAVPLGEHRVTALEALGRIGGTEAEAALITVLQHRDDRWNEIITEDWDDYRDAQRKALDALSGLQSTRAIPSLRNLLRNPHNEDLHQPGVDTLMALGPVGHDVLRTLLPHLQHALQRRIVVVLGELGDPADGPLIRTLLEGDNTRVTAASLSTLARLGTYLAGDGLKRWLHHADSAVRVAAVDHLAAQPVDGLEKEWAQLLNDRDGAVRQAAIRAASKTGSRAFAPVLQHLVNDEVQSVSLAAIDALAESGEEDLSDTLLPILRDIQRHPIVRLRALLELQRRPSEPLQEALMKCLMEPDPALHREALAALAGIVESGAPAFLISILKGELTGPMANTDADTIQESDQLPPDGLQDVGLHSTAAPSEDFRDGGPLSTLDAVLHPEPNLRDPNREELEDPLSDNEQSLLRRIDTEIQVGNDRRQQWHRPAELDLRIHAAHLLADEPSERALAPLREALCEPIASLQEEAARTLGALGDSDAVDLLAATLASPHASVANAAVKSLAAIGGETAHSALKTGWSLVPGSVRPALLDALGQTSGKDTERILREALNHEDPAVVKVAANAILRLGLSVGLDDLLQPLAQYPDYFWKGIGEGIKATDVNGMHSALVCRLASPSSHREIPLLLNLVEEMFCTEV